MKRVFIIHGWDGTPTVGWFAWLKKELKGRGFKVLNPKMPNPENPEINVWVSFISELVKNPDQNTYFVGHSIGCQAILRYLGRLPEITKIGGVICVSGWFVLKDLENKEDWETARPWLMPQSLWDISKPMFKQRQDMIKEWLSACLSCQNLKGHLHNFVAIFSDNDPYIPLEINKHLFEILGAKIRVTANMYHMSEDDYDQLPIVLEELLKMTR